MNNTTVLMNNTSLELLLPDPFKCLPVQDKIPLLSTRIRQTLAAIHISIMCVDAFANTVVTYLIYHTEQYRNQSTRLVMYLSITDIFGAFIINGASMTYMLFYEYLSCAFLMIIHSLMNGTMSLTYMLIFGISIDRMLKVRFLSNYSMAFTPFRFKLLIIGLLFLTGLQSTLIVVGIYFFGYGYATILTVPVYLICAVTMVICYILSIRKLREMNTISQRISNSDRSIVKVATLHLAIFLGCFACIMPVVVWQIVSNLFLSKELSDVVDTLTVFLLNILISIHSTLNAFMFLTVNRNSRRALVSIIHGIEEAITSRFSGNRVMPAHTDQS